MNSPCHNCTERIRGCHARCEAYQTYYDENIKRNEEQRVRNEIKHYQRAFHDRYLRQTWRKNK
jgi:hypothetical protein